MFEKRKLIKIRVITGNGISIRFRSNINNAKVPMIVYLKSFIFIAILRGNLGKSTTKLEKNKFQHLGKRQFQVITRTTLLQIQVVHNRFWSSLTIRRRGISNTDVVSSTPRHEWGSNSQL